MDDLQISKIDPAINNQLIGSLDKIYQNKIAVACRKVYDYLGMIFYMSEKGVAGTSMIKYLNKLFPIFLKK